MELARVFAQSGIEFDATLVFACWAGEEQGLFGSRAHAGKIASDGIAIEGVSTTISLGTRMAAMASSMRKSVRVYALGPEDSAPPDRSRVTSRRPLRFTSRHTKSGSWRERTGLPEAAISPAFNQHGYPAVVFREANENFSIASTPPMTR